MRYGFGYGFGPSGSSPRVQSGLGQVGFSSTSATAQLLLTLALPANSASVVTVTCFARDTGTNYYLKKSVTNWIVGIGGAIQKGSDESASATDAITVTGLIVEAESDHVVIKYGGSDSVHTSGYIQSYFTSTLLVAAT